MDYANNYFKAFLQVAGYLGILLMLINSALLDPLAIYFLFVSCFVAMAGPIAVSIGKKEKT